MAEREAQQPVLGGAAQMPPDPPPVLAAPGPRPIETAEYGAGCMGDDHQHHGTRPQEEELAQPDRPAVSEDDAEHGVLDRCEEQMEDDRGADKPQRAVGEGHSKRPDLPLERPGVGRPGQEREDEQQQTRRTARRHRSSPVRVTSIAAITVHG